jgi:uncharacterized protein YoxC
MNIFPYLSIGIASLAVIFCIYTIISYVRINKTIDEIVSKRKELNNLRS